MKLYKSKKDPEVYYYFTKKKEKFWMYRHKYKDIDGNRREKKKSSFSTEEEALKALLEIKASLLNGQQMHVEHNQMTISQWFDIWFETYSINWGVKTSIRRKDVIERQIKPMIGKFNLIKLDKSTYLRNFINPLLKKYSPGTVHLFHRVFNIGINAAVDDEIVYRNRFRNIKINRDDKLENFFTPKELNLFLSTADKFNPTRSTLIYLLAYTGVRRGEALGLKWENVDFTKKKISIVSTRDKYGYRIPKTQNSYRTIRIDEPLLSKLRAYKRWCKQIKFKYGMKLDNKKDFVFISSLTGEPIGETLIYQSFRIIYKELKKQGINLKRITPHGLRHTHATIMINNGVPPKTVADRLGNTVEMVYKVYSHSFDEIEEKALSIFSDSLIEAKTGAEIGAK